MGPQRPAQGQEQSGHCEPLIRKKEAEGALSLYHSPGLRASWRREVRACETPAPAWRAPRRRDSYLG